MADLRSSLINLRFQIGSLGAKIQWQETLTLITILIIKVEM